MDKIDRQNHIQRDLGLGCSYHQITFETYYEKVFGYKLPATKVSYEKWMAFFQPEEREVMKRKIKRPSILKKRHFDYPFPP
jgi:hypothetical protein